MWLRVVKLFMWKTVIYIMNGGYYELIQILNYYEMQQLLKISITNNNVNMIQLMVF